MTGAAPSGSTSQRRQTALAAIDAYNKWSLDAIMAYRSDDCITQVLPKSLGRPEMNNQEYRVFFGNMIPHFRDFHVVINDIFEDETENKIVLWAHSTASTDIGPYANEYMLAWYFNESGTKITKFLEFVDSANSHSFFPKLQEHLAQKGAGGT
ncbi:hypothetical protein F5Y15DRAFT_212825 [Xylariaceae sp. FL0016]|nr:hypothetical protein F5Y15DRAFT_212825 [Xylariaceae sp. FL0016]